MRAVACGAVAAAAGVAVWVGERGPWLWLGALGRRGSIGGTSAKLPGHQILDLGAAAVVLGVVVLLAASGRSAGGQPARRFLIGLCALGLVVVGIIGVIETIHGIRHLSSTLSSVPLPLPLVPVPGLSALSRLLGIKGGLGWGWWTVAVGFVVTALAGLLALAPQRRTTAPAALRRPPE